MARNISLPAVENKSVLTPRISLEVAIFQWANPRKKQEYEPIKRKMELHGSYWTYRHLYYKNVYTPVGKCKRGYWKK